MNIEQGRYDPSFKTMVNIACALGVSVAEFVEPDEG
jgi:DNA-binding XRE family transcriptional regulator